MFCPKCGKINDDSMEKCSGCGAALQESLPAPVKKSGKVWKIIFTAVIVIAVVCIIAFLLGGCTGGEVNPNESVRF